MPEFDAYFQNLEPGTDSLHTTGKAKMRKNAPVNFSESFSCLFILNNFLRSHCDRIKNLHL